MIERGDIALHHDLARLRGRPSPRSKKNRVLRAMGKHEQMIEFVRDSYDDVVANTYRDVITETRAAPHSPPELQNPGAWTRTDAPYRSLGTGSFVRALHK